MLKRQCIGYPNGNRLHSLSSKLLNLFLWAWCLEVCLAFQDLFLLLHQRLSLVLKLKFVNDLFVLDFLDFESFMYLYKDNLVVTYTVKISCEWNCTSSGFSCDFSGLTNNQSPQGLLCDIFEKFSSLLLSFCLLLCSLVHIWSFSLTSMSFFCLVLVTLSDEYGDFLIHMRVISFICFWASRHQSGVLLWHWPQPTFRSWQSQCGFYGSWSLPCMLLLLSMFNWHLSLFSVSQSFYSLLFFVFPVSWYIVGSEISIRFLMGQYSFLFRNWLRL